jgi:hypothetical protein
MKLKKKIFASYYLLFLFLSRIYYILILEIIVVHNISIILLIRNRSDINQGPCSRKYPKICPKICLRTIFRMVLGQEWFRSYHKTILTSDVLTMSYVYLSHKSCSRPCPNLGYVAKFEISSLESNHTKNYGNDCTSL